MEINCTAFDEALRGLEQELNHTVAPIITELQRDEKALEMVRDWLYNKEIKSCSL